MELIKTILSESGFKEGKTFKETRFLKPPTSTYAIYLDSYDSRGADDFNLIKDHSYTIELYASTPDPEAERRISDILDKYAIYFNKNDRTWIQEEQLYLTSYYFNYTEKLRR